MPYMKNCTANDRDCGVIFPSGEVRAPKKPMTNEPETFTTSVPQGKVSPNLFETSPPMPYRAMLPSAPPIAIQRYASIKFLRIFCFFAGVISAETVRRFPHLGRQTPLPRLLIFGGRLDGNGKPLTGGGCPGMWAK